jgi:hypothetical protein
MALTKNISYRGVSANYVKVGPYRWDPYTREASVILSLFLSSTRAASHPHDPLCPVFAKLRLTGDKFDQYVSKEQLNLAAENAGLDIVGCFYEAVKAGEPLISDFGSDALAGATDA